MFNYLFVSIDTLPNFTSISLFWLNLGQDARVAAGAWSIVKAMLRERQGLIKNIMKTTNPKVKTLGFLQKWVVWDSNPELIS